MAVYRRKCERRIRYTAGTARIEDGQCGCGLADEPRHADQVGTRLHQVHLRHPVRCVVFLARTRVLLTVFVCYRTLIFPVILVTALLGQFWRKEAVVTGTIAGRQHPACDGCPERRVALNLRHISAPLPWPG